MERFFLYMRLCLKITEIFSKLKVPHKDLNCHFIHKNEEMVYNKHGKNSVSLELLWKICLYLDISMDSVMMDQTIMRPRIMLDSDILPKLEKCDTPTLTVVNGFIDHLLVIKNDYIKKLATEVSVDQESRKRYEHKIVFVEKK